VPELKCSALYRALCLLLKVCMSVLYVRTYYTLVIPNVSLGSSYCLNISSGTHRCDTLDLNLIESSTAVDC
jgi:hypothetical protein